MKKTVLIIFSVFLTIFLTSVISSAQSESMGRNLLNEGVNIYNKSNSKADLEKSLKKIEASIAIFEKVKKPQNLAHAFLWAGYVERDLDNYHKSSEYFEQSLSAFRKAGEVAGEGIALGNIGLLHHHFGKHSLALNYYQKAYEIYIRNNDLKSQASSLNAIGLAYQSFGQYSKALESHEKSLELSKRLKDSDGEATSLNNMGLIYTDQGQYTKALDYLNRTNQILVGNNNVKNQATLLNNIGMVYWKLGQNEKALDFFEKALSLQRKVGSAAGQGTVLSNIADLQAQTGNYEQAIKTAYESIQLLEKTGVPTKPAKNSIANYYLDTGNIMMAEPLVNETGYPSTHGRLCLMKSDFKSAINYYKKDVSWAEESGNADALFRDYTGLGRAYEGLEDYQKAEECYEKAMKVTEEMRSTILLSERRNFFEVRIGGFQRSEPAKGLTRVRMKLNLPNGSIESSEVTRARSFSEHLAEISSVGATGIPREVMEKESSLVNKVAALKKELSKIDRQKQSGKFDILSNEVKESERELNLFIENLWERYPSYAAVKYPRPVSLKECGLRPDEYAVIFDVSNEGVGVKLIYNKEINQTFYVKWPLEEMEKDIKNLREPMEKLRFKAFDTGLASKLYRRLLQRALLEVPKGAPLIIIPDGILAILPFEVLVTSGQANWNKAPLDGYPDELRDYPENITFVGDEYPISYYQSVTALTLARATGKKAGFQNKTLVVADPVFSMKDSRAQQATQTNVAEAEKIHNIETMKAIEEGQVQFNMKRLPRTSLLADELEKIYGKDCLALTGLKANKSDFMSKIAPQMDTYSNIVFATHGVMSTKIPGLMEPFLALTMAPPGTDGFLKMSDILSLKMNADVVALTACQTGLGKDLSGEGVMSMGRAFQFAGAKSVLMTLWEVEEASAIKLTSHFFQRLKDGKTKLEALLLAREDIKREGYRHPYFWSGFVLVGETN